MTGRRMRAAIALAAVAFLLCAAGCGRKAPPEPRSTSGPAAQYHDGTR
jgi:predicted small lipoprotein YifL